MVDFNGFDRGVIGKPLPADSTLNNMKKQQLLELLHIAEHNHSVLAEAYKCAIDNSKCNSCPLTQKEKNSNSWIPVSERLPEYGEVVLCSCANNGITVSAVTFKGLKKGKEVQFGQHYVTAWMPLPEPYREENDGKTD